MLGIIIAKSRRALRSRIKCPAEERKSKGKKRTRDIKDLKIYDIVLFVINVTYIWLRRNRSTRRAFINDVTSPTSGFPGPREPRLFGYLGNKRYRSGVGARRRGGARLFPSKTITLLKGTAGSPPKRRRTHSRPVSEKRSKANCSQIDLICRGVATGNCVTLNRNEGTERWWGQTL